MNEYYHNMIYLLIRWYFIVKRKHSLRHKRDLRTSTNISLSVRFVNISLLHYHNIHSLSHYHYISLFHSLVLLLYMSWNERICESLLSLHHFIIESFMHYIYKQHSHYITHTNIDSHIMMSSFISNTLSHSLSVMVYELIHTFMKIVIMR